MIAEVHRRHRTLRSIRKANDDDVDDDGRPTGTDRDCDGDRTPNGRDRDIDGDGVRNANDATPNGELILQSPGGRGDAATGTPLIWDQRGFSFSGARFRQ
jgi:hypothetical protein